MITDKNSTGYKIALNLVDIYLDKGSDAASKYYTDATQEMKFWIQLAIKDTFQALIKGSK